MSILKEGHEALKLVNTAKKNGLKEVVVFKTAKKHHKKGFSPTNGLGINDLTPKYKELYLYLLGKFNLDTRLISLSECKVEWFVKL